MKVTESWLSTHEAIWRKPEKKFNLLLQTSEHWFPTLVSWHCGMSPIISTNVIKCSKESLEVKLVLFHLKIDGPWFSQSKVIRWLISCHQPEKAQRGLIETHWHLGRHIWNTYLEFFFYHLVPGNFFLKKSNNSDVMFEKHPPYSGSTGRKMRFKSMTLPQKLVQSLNWGRILVSSGLQ